MLLPTLVNQLKLLMTSQLASSLRRNNNNNKQISSTPISSNPTISTQPVNSNIAGADSKLAAANTSKTPNVSTLSELIREESNLSQRSNSQKLPDNSTGTDVDNQPAEDKTSIESAVLPEQQAPYKTQNLDLKKVKIVQNKSEDFWEES